MDKINFIKVLRKSGTSLTVSVPPEIISVLNLKEGDLLKVELQKFK